jgi:hypothetical protein
VLPPNSKLETIMNLKSFGLLVYVIFTRFYNLNNSYETIPKKEKKRIMQISKNKPKFPSLFLLGSKALEERRGLKRRSHG